MSLNRREMLRLGAMGAAGVMLSSSASSNGLPTLLAPAQPPLMPKLQPAAPTQALTPTAPGGIDPQLFAKAKAALDTHKVWPRDTIAIADFSKPSSEPRFYV